MDTLDKNQAMEVANKILTEEEFRGIHTEINNIEINTNPDLNTLTKSKNQAKMKLGVINLNSLFIS